MEKINIAKKRLYIKRISNLAANSVSFTGVATVKGKNSDGWCYVYIPKCDIKEGMPVCFVHYRNFGYSFGHKPSWQVEPVIMKTNGGTLPTTRYTGGGGTAGGVSMAPAVIDAVNLNLYREAGAEYVLPIPTKEGASFLGWYDNPEFSGNAVTKIKKGETGSKTFYAGWIEADPSAAPPPALNRSHSGIVLNRINDSSNYLEFIPAIQKAAWKEDPEGDFPGKMYKDSNYATYVSTILQEDHTAPTYFWFDLLIDPKMASSSFRLRKALDVTIYGDGKIIAFANQKVANPKPENGWHRYLLKAWQTIEDAQTVMHYSLMIDGEWLTDEYGETYVFSKSGNYLYSLDGNGKLTANGGDSLAYVTEGGCDYLFPDGQRLTAKAGDILFLSDRSDYKMILTDRIYSTISFNLLFDSNEERQSTVYSPPLSYGAENLFKKLLRAYRSTEASYLCDCMSYVYRIYGIITAFENSSYTGRSAREKMTDVKDYIQKNYDDLTLSVEKLAALSEMSEVYFRRLFKSAFGINPTQYILSVRLERSKKLLLEGCPGLSECARLAGFSSPQYFCKVFKEKYGITPAKFGRDKRD